MPQLDLNTAIARVDRVQPNLPPQLKMRALERMMPILNQQAQQQLAQLRLGFEERSLAERERHNRILEGGGASGQTGSGLMSQDAIDAAAERYLKTGQLPPNLGRGIQGRADMAAIQNRAAGLAQERGVDFGALPKKWQEFKGEQIAIQRFLSGPQGNTIRSLNVVTDHLTTLQGLGDALQNNDIPAFNRVAQMWAEQTGQPEPTNFDTAKQIVGAEIIKALGVAGAGTKEERQEAADAFNRAKSPAQLKGAIASAQKLLTGQLKGLRKQFTVSTGLPGEKFDEMMLEETKKFMGMGEAAGSAAPSAGTPVKVQTPEDAARLKPGTRYTTPDGQEYVR